jgi:outer membrane murein-binding lipoprotein Lpp
MKKKIKKVTLDSLGNTVGSLSVTVGSLSTTVENLSTKVDKLASAMENGFKRLDGKMDAGFKRAEENHDSLARMVKGGFDDVMERLETKADKSAVARLEQGQENMQLRLDYLAPQFEVKELTRRVKRLEDKVGIRSVPAR